MVRIVIGLMLAVLVGGESLAVAPEEFADEEPRVVSSGGFPSLSLSSHAVEEAESTEVASADWMATPMVTTCSALAVVLGLFAVLAWASRRYSAKTSPGVLPSELVSVLRVRAQEKNLSLDYSWAGPVPIRMISDESRLRQLLLNLIGNAIKFTPQGGVQVVAELIGTDQGGTPAIKIDVVDTGVGIPTEKIDSIFDPFAQADTSVTRKFGGTGLGLTISRRVAEALGGGLTVYSEVGSGSVFTAVIAVGLTGVIPVQASVPQSPRGDVLPDAAANQSAGDRSIAGARVLLVEDGRTNRRMIDLMLRGHDVEVTMAEHGQAAVEAIEQSRFDVVLMDMQMPVMDGYTAAGILRERGVTTPIIALTAHAMKGDEQKCLDAGCTAYLTKPIAEEVLVRTLRNHLSGDQDHHPTKTKVINTDPKPHQPSPSVEADPIRSCYPNDDADYREIIEDFIGQMRGKKERLQTLVADEQYDDLRFEAHWMKGTAGTAGFDQFTVPAIRLRRSLDSRDTATIEASLDVILDMIDRMTV